MLSATYSHLNQCFDQTFGANAKADVYLFHLPDLKKNI